MSDAALDLIGEKLVIVARWLNCDGDTIMIQDFTASGESFIPLFSDTTRFKAEAAGSGFENEGVEIDLELLVSILRGDELLVLYPASTKLRLCKSDLQTLIHRRGE